MCDGDGVPGGAGRRWWQREGRELGKGSKALPFGGEEVGPVLSARIVLRVSGGFERARGDRQRGPCQRAGYALKEVVVLRGVFAGNAGRHHGAVCGDEALERIDT